MEIRTYNAEQLEAFVNSDEFAQLKNLPISMHRAISHVRNPRLDPTKNLLYVAYENNEVVGYRLMLCDHIYIDDQPKPIAWFSCVWVHPGMRGKGIAKGMMKMVLDEWGDNIVYSNPVPASRELYLSLGFKGPIPLLGMRGYMRSNMAELGPNRYPKFKALKPLWHITDSLINAFQDARLRFGDAAQNTPKGLEQVEAVSDEIADFIAPFQTNELFRRNKAELNWITQYPWILSGEPTEESKRYYFSAIDKRFEFRHLVLRDGSGKIIMYMLAAFRNQKLNLPYLYFKARYTEQVAEVIIHMMLTEKLSTVTTFNPHLAQYLKKNDLPFLFVKSIQRDYYAAQKFIPYFETDPPNFMEGDGDQAFT